MNRTQTGRLEKDEKLCKIWLYFLITLIFLILIIRTESGRKSYFEILKIKETRTIGQQGAIVIRWCTFVIAIDVISL